MPQMMPLLWVLNLIYTSLMINLYTMSIHYTPLSSNFLCPPPNKTNKMKIPLLW